MRYKTFGQQLIFCALICASLAFIPSLDAGANRSERVNYDVEGNIIGIPSGGGRLNSNKSPIPRKIVSFSGSYKPGTIVVKTKERRLYHVLSKGTAMRYGIGVGRQGFTWSGTNRITRKEEWPDWRPPVEMRRREPNLPVFMGGGPDNPLGARALYLGSTLYRIHGSNASWSIGGAVSSGCIRMANDDVVYLYNQIKLGTRVVVK